MKILALVLLMFSSAAEFASAQAVAIGAFGGVSLIDPTTGRNSGGNHDESRIYIVGPSVEVRLPAGFAIEADGLYQRLGNTIHYQLLTAIGSFGSEAVGLTNRLRANMWQFPVLGKYYFRHDSTGWQPFIGSGWAFRFAEVHQAGVETTVDGAGVLSSFSFKDSFRSDLEVGAVFAAGVRYQMGRFAFSPQVRYTRWGGQSNIFRKNEAAAGLGISF